MRATRVLESVLYADDLVAAKAFYEDVLGLRTITFDPERNLFLQCGDSVVILFRALKTLDAPEGFPAHGAVGPGHLAFASDHAELDAWVARLEEAGAAQVLRKTWGNGARSVYFRDPAGNSLEFATPDLWPLE